MCGWLKRGLVRKRSYHLNSHHRARNWHLRVARAPGLCGGADWRAERQRAVPLWSRLLCPPALAWSACLFQSSVSFRTRGAPMWHALWSRVNFTENRFEKQQLMGPYSPLHEVPPCGTFPALSRASLDKPCCRSSGVEHSLGKGEAECSIHSGSTIISRRNLQPAVLA